MNSQKLRVVVSEPLYTVAEVAKMMRVCEKTVRKEIDSNNLGFTKIRGALRVSETEYRAYVERNTVRSIVHGA